jgi:ferric-dicitrate binding protein FerR (iron transport regulator)
VPCVGDGVDRDSEHDEAWARDLLVRARPDLDAARRDAIERQVLGRGRRRPHRPLRLAAALAGALAALVLVLGAAGAFRDVGGADVVRATPDCRYVLGSATVTQPAEAGDGAAPRLVTQAVQVGRYSLRCR